MAHPSHPYAASGPVLGRRGGGSLWRNLIDVLVWCGPLPFAGAVLDASGAIRVEAGRIWMPYFPVILMAAVPTLRRLLPGRWLWLGGGLQLAHTWVLVSRWGS